MPNLVALDQTVWVLLGGPKHFGDPGPRPLGCEWLDPWRQYGIRHKTSSCNNPQCSDTVSWEAWACGKPCVSDSQWFSSEGPGRRSSFRKTGLDKPLSFSLSLSLSLSLASGRNIHTRTHSRAEQLPHTVKHSEIAD